MKIRLDAARYEPFLWQESIELTEEEKRDLELLEISPVRCQGHLTLTAPDFLLHAGLRYEQTVSCNRCLKPVQQEVESAIDLVLVERSRKREATEEEQLEAQELGLVEVEGGVFESRPLILEQVELSLPMKPLCREDCAGLCPQCGQDWNEERCSCILERVDPRWAALAALKEPRAGGAG
ncbi:MAG: DUF177 domain-containing protein [Thermoanaerobaculia bacterium]